MAQGDKKTKRGIGEEPPHQASRHSDVPTSHLRENSRNGSSDASETTPVSVPSPSQRDVKATQPGMPKLKKKIVTKVGVAPPSDPPPPLAPRSQAEADKLRTNPGLTAPPPLDQMQFGSDEEEGDRISSREEFTPREGSDLRNLNEDDEETSDRSRFRTAPGGGRNRVSGGRAQASAYVSPSTLPPEQGRDHITSAIKVDEVVRNAVRAYETEPSLMRRRASSLPPRMPLPQEKRNGAALVLGALVLGLVLGAGILWAAMNSLRTGEQAEILTDDDDANESPGQAPLRDGVSKNSPAEATEKATAAPSVNDASPASVPSQQAPVGATQIQAPALKEASTLSGATSGKAPTPSQVSSGSIPPRTPEPSTAPKANSPNAPPNDLWLE